MAKTKSRSKDQGKGFIACGLRLLPEKQQPKAAEVARQINPGNTPLLDRLIAFLEGLRAKKQDELPKKEALAVLTTKYWGAAGVNLRVAFMDGGSTALKDRILSHMNAWSKLANVKFNPGSLSNAEVRITRQRGDGYWSYLGTDIKLIPANEPTMNLDSFSTDTPEGEYLRVVRHETGHTLGFPHEHLRKELIDRLDYSKTVAYFRQTYGWSESMTVSNVLTPLSEASIRGTPEADDDSIMCYQLPGSITKDRKPIPGGPDINDLDANFCGQLYPLAEPPEPPTESVTRVVVLPDTKTVRLPAGWTVVQGK